MANEHYKLDDKQYSSLRYDGAEMATDYDTGEPKINNEGLKRFDVSCVARQIGAKKSQVIEVRVFLPKHPDEALEPGADIHLSDLWLHTYEYNGHSGTYLTAKNISKTQPAKQ